MVRQRPMAIECQVIRAGEISAHLDKLAYLRTMVFREWPYLYDGDPDNERDYLRNYAVPGAVLVLAEDAGRVVGAATAMALTSHGDAVQMSLPPSAPPPKEIYYLAESVLLPEFRGQGIGHRFFDCREEAAL
ncbi:MAG: GNAT family N-acetyltransferase [Pseudomonadota bacterium]